MLTVRKKQKQHWIKSNKKEFQRVNYLVDVVVDIDLDDDDDDDC